MTKNIFLTEIEQSLNEDELFEKKQEPMEKLPCKQIYLDDNKITRLHSFDQTLNEDDYVSGLEDDTTISTSILNNKCLHVHVKANINDDNNDGDEKLNVKTFSNSLDSHFNNISKDDSHHGNTTLGNKVSKIFYKNNFELNSKIIYCNINIKIFFN